MWSLMPVASACFFSLSSFFEFLVCFSCFFTFFRVAFPYFKIGALKKKTCFWDGGGTFLFLHVCSFVSSFFCLCFSFFYVFAFLHFHFPLIFSSVFSLFPIVFHFFHLFFISLRTR